MTVRVRFRCERCCAVPDAMTQLALEAQLLDDEPATYLDAQPGGWLVWTAGGLLGPKRYACPRHREALVDDLRARHGHSRALRAAVEQEPPYAMRWPRGVRGLDDRELESLLAGTWRPTELPS